MTATPDPHGILARLQSADLRRHGELLRLCEDAAEEIARLNGALAGRSVEGKIADDLRQELQILRRLYDAKSLECARLQKRVEKLEGKLCLGT